MKEYNVSYKNPRSTRLLHKVHYAEGIDEVVRNAPSGITKGATVYLLYGITFIKEVKQ